MSGKRTSNFRPPTREAARIRKAVRRQRGEVTLTANNHLRIEAPNGLVTVVGCHYGCPRSFRNAMSKIKRDTGLVLGLTPA